jgi:CBS-domain-containing membrane protein
MNAALRENAKAWVALIGAVVTGLLGTVPPDHDVYEWLTFIAAACTAILTYAIPNAPHVEQPMVRR